MSLQPLLQAAPVIQVHAFAAVAALLLGSIQLMAPKGTLPHRVIGWTWVALMATIGITAFFIHQIRFWGQWSPIHLLAVYVLVMLPLGVLRARRHDVSSHRKTMVGLFIGGLVIAGLFTFVPGRIMYHVVFGH
jgi:uncharacterized membrane protein